ncbi:MAG: hypothetical protein HZA52_21695 [Planctomycetes bacterium]|nr:hypothetical protein [Planctomycetota bacterium]
MSARSSRWQLVLGLVGLFLIGTVTGVFLSAAYVHHRIRALHEGGPAAIHALGMDWFQHELRLNEDQVAGVEAVLGDVHRDLLRFKGEHEEEIRVIVVRGVERINALLTDDQRERWEPIRRRVLGHVAGTEASEPTE